MISEDVYIGIGSNQGNRYVLIQKALQKLSDIAINVKISNIYQSAAQLPKNSPNHWHQEFLNAVIKCNYAGTPIQLLAQLKDIERELGRPTTEQQNAPRNIDLDILLFGKQQIDSANLVIPHPRIKERLWVLLPLAEFLQDTEYSFNNGNTINYIEVIRNFDYTDGQLLPNIYKYE